MQIAPEAFYSQQITSAISIHFSYR